MCVCVCVCVRDHPPVHVCCPLKDKGHSSEDWYGGSSELPR